VKYAVCIFVNYKLISEISIIRFKKEKYIYIEISQKQHNIAIYHVF